MPGVGLARLRHMTQRPSVATVQGSSELRGVSRSFSETLDQVASHVSACCHVDHVFGAPVAMGDTWVIPVAQSMGGFGAGAGAGAGSEPRQDGLGGGMGGGAGFIISPCGAFVVDRHGARFERSRPATGVRSLLGELARNLLQRWLSRS